MIIFALSVYFCVSATECRWHFAGYFLYEGECRNLGEIMATDDPQIIRFKCVADVREGKF